MGKNNRRDRYNIKLMAVGLLVVVVSIVEIYSYTWCTVQCTRLRYEIGRQEKMAVTLAAEEKNLRIELARLKSPARIIEIARERLGMVIPESGQVIIVP